MDPISKKDTDSQAPASRDAGACESVSCRKVVHRPCSVQELLGFDEFDWFGRAIFNAGYIQLRQILARKVVDSLDH